MDIPPPIPPRPPGYEIHTPIPPDVSNDNNKPPLPPRLSPAQQQQQQYQQYQQGAWTGYAQPPCSFPAQAPLPQAVSFSGDSGGGGGGGGTPMARWTPLFHPDGAPTPFSRRSWLPSLDVWIPAGQGILGRRRYRGKSNLKGGNFLYTSEDLADYELKACCEAWYFDHKTVVRHRGRNQIPYGGMPLLSLRGFTDMMAVESAGEPERGWRGLNAALRHYGIWPAMGPLPREVFLQDMPRQLQQRLEQVKIRSHRAAQERLDAARVQAQIQAQGRQPVAPMGRMAGIV
ncbi:uncharacterized protein PG986_009448 [Apiospora aurea]|uniref:Uncharacterized protein n=1 Tax=Apiospora aurea TaxID=335848 RepID=A0ABR1Q7Q6_9PEZI